MKNIYGRWYHICLAGKIIVFLWDDGKWRKLPKIKLKKYRHDCF